MRRPVFMRLTLMRLLAALILVIGTVVSVAPAPAMASPDAQVDQEIRPCFGVLIKLPRDSRRCASPSHYRRHCPSGLVKDYTGRCIYPGAPFVPEVDCDYAYPGAVQRKIDQLYEGETLTLRSRYKPCVESLVISRPINIVAVNYNAGLDHPILVAPPGQPCLRILPGIPYLRLRGLMIEALGAGAEACISGKATQLVIEDSVIRYDGEGSAIDLSGGKLEMRDVTVIAKTRQPAVRASGTASLDRVGIAAAVIGLAFEADGDSRLSKLDLVRLGDWSGSSRVRSSVGLALGGLNRQQLVQINDLVADGFSRGVYIGGGDEVTLQHPVVRDADWAVLLEQAKLRIFEGELQAADVGLYVASGTADAADNKIIGVMRAGIFADQGAQVRARDNLVFPREGGCQALTTGYFNGALTCKPWFEAPDIYRSPSDRQRSNFDSFWPSRLAIAGPSPTLLAPPPPAAADPHKP